VRFVNKKGRPDEKPSNAIEAIRRLRNTFSTVEIIRPIADGSGEGKIREEFPRAAAAGGSSEEGYALGRALLPSGSHGRDIP